MVKQFCFSCSFLLYLGLYLTAILNSELGCGVAWSCTSLCKSSQDVLFIFLHSAEHTVGTVEPVTWDKGEEELGPVCVGSCVRHGQQATSVMTNVKVFVCEFFSIDGYASRPVSLCEITSLGHKVLNHAMEVAPLVAKLLLVVTCAQAAEVFCSLWYLISVKLQEKTFRFQHLPQTECRRAQCRS